ncbi:MAG TPA: PepSY-associated TM helix domain-containing protein [Gemmatimonadaceae bacterium]|nr:PepSY-associated TM helix domain-containing protein [Gemmatimonadaceae bacterium]
MTALRVFHRWLALITAVLVVVVAVSGSALVFEGAIDRALNPQLWRVDPGASAVSLDTLVAHASAAAPKMPVTGLGLSTVPGRAFVAQAGPMQVFEDPYTGKVLGTRDVRLFQKTLPRRLHVLHTALLTGKRGSAVVAIITIASLVLVLTGIVLWLPDRIFRITSTASWKRVVFDLHHALGVLAAIVLVIITASGLVIHYDALRDAIFKLDKSPAPFADEQSAMPRGTPTISMDTLALIARRALPGASITFLNTPPNAQQSFQVSMRFPEDRTPGGRSRILVDRYSGDILLAVSTRQAEPGTRINNVIRSVHTGDLYGKPTQLIWFLAALIMASQAVTGALMWWNARRKR